MPESSQELYMPTNQEVLEANKPKFEPSLFKKTIKHLKNTGQIALLATVLATACDKADKPEPTPHLDNTPHAVQTIEKMPSVIPINPIAEIQKIKIWIGPETNQTQEALDRYETIYQNIEKLTDAHEAKTTGGKPTLLVQQKEKFGQADFSPIWEGKYENEEDFLQDQIFFLHDQKIVQEAILKMSQDQNLTTLEIQDTLAQSEIDFMVPGSVYLEMDTKSENAWNFEANVPQNIKNALSAKEPLGLVNVKVENRLSGGYFTPYPPTITLGENTPAEVALHELGHATDIVENPNILKSISPQKAIDLLVARNNAILSTRQYDNFEKLYSDSLITATKKANEGTPLTEEEINAQIAFLSNRILTNPTAERGSPVTENLFASYLKNDQLDNFKTGTNLYKTNQEFMEKESANLDQLATENPLYKIVIEQIRKNPDLFENYYGGTNQEPLPGFVGRPAQKYYDSLQTEFAPAILSTMIFENDENLTGVLDSDQKINILENLLKLNKIMERELIAPLYQQGITDKSSSTANEYLENFTD